MFANNTIIIISARAISFTNTHLFHTRCVIRTIYTNSWSSDYLQWGDLMYVLIGRSALELVFVATILIKTNVRKTYKIYEPQTIFSWMKLHTIWNLPQIWWKIDHGQVRARRATPIVNTIAPNISIFSAWHNRIGVARCAQRRSMRRRRAPAGCPSRAKRNDKRFSCRYN